MKQVLAVVFLLVASLSSFAQKKSTFPTKIVVARYVMVVPYFGSEYSIQQVSPEVRRALGDVRAEISSWGKYVVVYKREEADLIFTVRRGVEEARGGINIHDASGVPTTVRPFGNVEAGSLDDTLGVYDARSGTDSAPLWRRDARHGLEAPSLPLLKQFRSDVEAAAAQQPAKKP